MADMHSDAPLPPRRNLASPKSATWASMRASRRMLLDLTSRCRIGGEQSW
uniref:Uncharacterized protein n=1 Tax=Arundo donax TaxID=35708 RepID=A0A0A9F8A2_ARUDO